MTGEPLFLVPADDCATTGAWVYVRRNDPRYKNAEKGGHVDPEAAARYGVGGRLIRRFIEVEVWSHWSTKPVPHQGERGWVRQLSLTSALVAVDIDGYGVENPTYIPARHLRETMRK